MRNKISEKQTHSISQSKKHYRERFNQQTTLPEAKGHLWRRGFISLTINYYNGNRSYLPWHAIYKNNSNHTTVRVVFDASCRDKLLRMSLNDFLWKRPKSANSLVEILLRFRLHWMVFEKRSNIEYFSSSENQRRRPKIVDIILPAQPRR